MRHCDETIENSATRSAKCVLYITRAVAFAFALSIMIAAVLVTVIDAQTITRLPPVDVGPP